MLKLRVRARMRMRKCKRRESMTSSTASTNPKYSGVSRAALLVRLGAVEMGVATFDVVVIDAIGNSTGL